MTLGCGCSPSVSGGVAQWVSRETASREWGREWESQNEVVKWSQKRESQK